MMIILPCGCPFQFQTDTFKNGQRGVSCARHEKSFIVEAVLPTEPTYEVVREVAYVRKEDG